MAYITCRWYPRLATTSAWAACIGHSEAIHETLVKRPVTMVSGRIEELGRWPHIPQLWYVSPMHGLATLTSTQEPELVRSFS